MRTDRHLLPVLARLLPELTARRLLGLMARLHLGLMVRLLPELIRRPPPMLSWRPDVTGDAARFGSKAMAINGGRFRFVPEPAMLAPT
jgi:hypothetical protein